MKNLNQDPLKTFLSIIGLAFVLFISVLATSCESRSERNFKQAQESKQAFEVVEHNAKAIIIETLHIGDFEQGIYKISVDSSEYILTRTYQGIAIVKHK